MTKYMQIKVEPFRKEAARELIERPIKGLFKLEEGVADHIVEVTGAKPYLIQRICIAVVNRMHEENRRTITLASPTAPLRLASVPAGAFQTPRLESIRA